MSSLARRHRRKRLRGQDRQLHQAGIRPWSDHPELLASVILPLFSKVPACVHLDGLETIRELREPAVWAPARLPSLLCGPCWELYLEDRKTDPQPAFCPSCREQLTSPPVIFSNAYDLDDDPLLVLGHFCQLCVDDPRRGAT